MSESPAFGVVGSGPAVDAVRAALGDEGYDARPVEPTEATTVEFAIVAGPAGDERFAQVDAVRAAPWLAIELGGIGGVAVDSVDGCVAAVDPAGPCFSCLTTRVEATQDSLPTDHATVARRDARLAGAIAGRLALDLTEEPERVGTVVELPYVARSLLPVPGCGCGGGREYRPDRQGEPVGLDETMARAERAVDDRLGPVTSIGEASSFPAPYYLAELYDTSGFSDAQASRQAAGVASDWNPAFVKAVGEALERYSAGVYRASSFVSATAQGLDDAITPDRFVRPAEGVVTPGPDEPLDWVAGVDLLTDEPVYLPAAFVHFPSPSARLAPAITTGLGLGTSGAGALVSGLTEVVERDATMLAWYSTFEPLALSVPDAAFDTLARRARAEDLEVTALLVTQDVDVPVVTVAVHRETDWPQFAVGSGAALDPIAAARGALEEALQNWMELRGMGSERAAEEEPTVARYASFPPEAQSLVAVEETVPATNVGPDDPPTGPAALEPLIDRVQTAGLDAYAARLTPRDVATIGFEAVRVLVPEAQPLFTGDRFFGERARTVPRELGFRPRLDRPPHPYP